MRPLANMGSSCRSDLFWTPAQPLIAIFRVSAAATIPGLAGLKRTCAEKGCRMSDPLDRNRQPTPNPSSVLPLGLVAWAALAAVVLVAPGPAAAADTSPGGPGQGDVTQLVAAVDPAVVTIHRPGGTGSGFVVDERGILVTNCHVVEGAAEAVAVFPDKTTFRIVGFLAFAPGKDLELLKFDPGTRKLAALPLSAADPAKGEKVYAFGAPLGLSGSVSDGLVAAVRRGPEVREILKELTGRDV